VRAALAWLACTTACGFQGAVQADDVIDIIDAAVPPDAFVPDAAIDAAPPTRTRGDLIGLWSFDETSGTTIADTSDTTDKVALNVTFGAVTFSNGMMMPAGVAVVSSDKSPHLNADVITHGAVTLEAWVVPTLAVQGSATQPALVAGLCSSINSRNISLLQAGSRWVARVRTTADPNGKPDLTSSQDIVAGALTHLVVVDDATQRILYVNGKPDAVDPAPHAPLGWDKAYKMALGNELAQGRQWTGAFALVAMYQRALSAELIDGNFKSGPAAR
jgi:hypothetical protein